MKVKSKKLKVKSESRNSAVNTAVLAAFLAVLFHGIAFSVPAYLIYANSKVKIQKSKVEQKNSSIMVELAVLPSVKSTGEKSVIKETAGKKASSENPEPGLNGQAEKNGAEDAEKEMLAYLDQVLREIQQSRRYPEEARKNSVQGSVNLTFTILQNGVLKNAGIIQPSGNEALDREALDTIRRASPFPEIPAAFGGREITRDVRIVFKID